jgi:protein TonB
VSTLRYAGLPRTGKPWLAMLISAALHAGLIFGFSRRVRPPAVVVVAEPPAIQLVMPDLTEPEEKKVEELNDDPVDAPAVAVPMLADVPISAPSVTAFVQPIDFVPDLKTDPAANHLVSIPTNIQHGRPAGSALKDIFNVSDLDRKPEAVSQIAPNFPQEMQKTYDKAQVVVGFIVTAKGDVVQPYIIHSTDVGFERETLNAVASWKFRPGYKGGRKVNTRVEQPVNFSVARKD